MTRSKTEIKVQKNQNQFQFSNFSSEFEFKYLLFNLTENKKKYMADIHAYLIIFRLVSR